MDGRFRDRTRNRFWLFYLKFIKKQWKNSVQDIETAYIRI
jgi:hypothetical protein